MAGFTPGPWQNGFDDLEGIVSLGAPDDGNVVCLPPSELMVESLGRWPENARLITAAPELYEALTSILDGVEDEGDGVDGVVLLPLYESQIKAGRAALRKAEAGE